MVPRRFLVALVALAAGTGCHAGLSGNGVRQAATPPVPRETVTVKRFVDQHNRNASAVKSLTASPAIELSGEGMRGARVGGLMAMERPRGFSLGLRATVGGKVADIGSNDQEFWFWVKDNKDKAIYVCDYKDVKDSALAVTYQPDWIIEAMGLREISDREASTIAASPGDEPGLLVLTQARNDPKGGMLTKETIVDQNKGGRIKEHRLWAGAKKDLLARAKVTEDQAIVLQATKENPSETTVYLPKRFRLEWVVEKFALDVTMANVKLNRAFTPEMRAEVFEEPVIAGTTRVNLAQLAGPATAASKVYESMPPPRSGIRLGRPEPMRTEVEGDLRPDSDSLPPPTSPANTSAARPTAVVRAPTPRAVDPDALQTSASRRSWRPSALARE